MTVQTLNQTEDIYHLSPMQQGMLFHSLYTSRPGMYAEQIIGTLAEALNVAAFERAWQQIVARHAIFRTSFDWQNLDEPRQQVHSQVKLPLLQQDWSGLPAQEQAERLETYLQTDRQQGFSLTEAPLMRIALFRLAEASYHLVWTFHHLLLDGRAMFLTLQELFAFYEAFCLGQDLSLKPPTPYRNYIDWLQRQDFSGAERFWREALHGFTTPTPLVVAHPPQPRPDPDGAAIYAEQEIKLSPAVTSTLQSLAQQYQFTLNNVVQGAWALLLSRYSGEMDVVFGVTRACRRSAVADAENIIGLFINTLPLRVQVPPEMKLLPWLQQLRRQQLAVRPYEHTPLVKVQQWSEIPRGTALFETILNFQSFPWDEGLRAQGGNWLRRQFKTRDQTNYALSLDSYGGSELLLRLDYDPLRFDRETITRLLGHLKTILEGMAANPESCLSALPMLTDAERQQLLFDWNNPWTEVASEPPPCIHQLFEAQVERTPEAIALIDGQAQLTYREVNRRANQLAHHLQTLGVGPEILVGICMERSPEMIVALLAVLKAGGAYVPLDPTYPLERLAFMIKDAQVAILLTRQKLIESLADLTPHLNGQAKLNLAGPNHQALENEAHAPLIICLDQEATVLTQENPNNPQSAVTTNNLAYVIYTSGSTGTPKGVMIEHRALVNFVEAATTEYALTAGDRVLQFASISFDTSAEEIYPCLTQGATLVLRTDEMISSTATFLQSCRDLAVTVLDLPTAYWHQLVSAQLAFPETLRLVIIGGEAVQPEAVRKWFDHASPATRLVNTYGPTEATVVATMDDLSTARNPFFVDLPTILPVSRGFFAQDQTK